MPKLKLGELFAGYGGLGMAVEAAFDAELAWVSEWDPMPSRILKYRWPNVPNYGDITKMDWANIEQVDIISGGSPCQDLSTAGKRRGMRDGTRSGLWENMRLGIEIQRPMFVVWENVRGAFSALGRSESDDDKTTHVLAELDRLDRLAQRHELLAEVAADNERIDEMGFHRGKADLYLEQRNGLLGEGQGYLRAFGRVLGDLADLGYDTQWFGLRAADVGAPHGRFRVFLLAHDADAHGLRSGEGLEQADGGNAQGTNHADERRPVVAGAVRRTAHDGKTRDPRTGRWAPLSDAGGEARLERPGLRESLSAGIGRGRLADGGSQADADADCRGRGGREDEVLRGSGEGTPVPGEAPSDSGDECREGSGHSASDRHPGESRLGVHDGSHRSAGGNLEADESVRTADGSEGCGDPGEAEAEGGKAVADAGRLERAAEPGASARGQASGIPAQHVGDIGWGDYEPAIRRWERVTGWPAPRPVEPSGRDGAERLNAAFTEWMMGLPPGHLTEPAIWDGLSYGAARNAQIKACGNGVVPQQAYAALMLLRAVSES